MMHPLKVRRCPHGTVDPASCPLCDHTKEDSVTKKAVLRKSIRAWMDRLEEAHYGNVPLTLTAKECGDLDVVFRRIQDMGATALGYK